MGSPASRFRPVNSPPPITTRSQETEPLNAYITPTPERALEMADAADERLARGEALPLDGIPIAVKDLFCTKGVLTTAASHILDGFHPALRIDGDREAVAGRRGDARQDQSRRVRDGLVEHDELLRPGREPVAPAQGDNRPLVPGGSSGGSAAAVAARAALAATGTDTGGSIRQPASFCGIVGLKPTYGRCSRWGVVAYASSLDHPGPMARTVRDAAIMLGAMAGHDPKDFDLGAGAGAGFRGGARRRHRGPARRHSQGIPGRRHAGRDRGVVAAGRRMAARGRRRAGRDQPADDPIRAAGLLHHRAGRGLVESGAL